MTIPTATKIITPDFPSGLTSVGSLYRFSYRIEIRDYRGIP